MRRKLDIYLYNTLTRKKEEFKPIDENIVKIYNCGPTVYNRAHIGNLKSYIFVDTLYKMFKYNGYQIIDVMNITDVGHLVSDGDTGEDKMIKASKRENLSPEEIAKKYEKIFFEDLEKLNIHRPSRIIRATDEIKSMEKYVKLLLEKGFAYKTENTIYFDTSKLDKYGVLSKVDMKEGNDFARIDQDETKRNLTDFALWIKAPENHIMKWDSFFGKAYPGWHLECSVISQKYLGDVFDVHTGGIDHIRYHHENEIAQSKGVIGKNPAHYWIHSGHLVLDNAKMSKSLGNVVYIQDIIDKGYNPLDFRYFCYLSNYKNKVNFTFDILDSAHKSLNNIYMMYGEHKSSELEISDEDLEMIRNWDEKFLKAINLSLIHI